MIVNKNRLSLIMILEKYALTFIIAAPKTNFFLKILKYNKHEHAIFF